MLYRICFTKQIFSIHCFSLDSELTAGPSLKTAAEDHTDVSLNSEFPELLCPCGLVSAHFAEEAGVTLLQEDSSCCCYFAEGPYSSLKQFYNSVLAQN